MTIRDLVTLENDEDGILRKRIDEVAEDEIPELKDIIQDMIETMYSCGGLGLAANQIGLNKRIFVLGVGGEVIVAINPVIVAKDPKKIKSYDEGCLSCPNEGRKDIRRHRKVRVAALNENGGAFEINVNNKVINIAVQHEIDHLNGVLIIDK